MHEERDQDIWWVLKPHATHSLPPSPSALTLWPHKPVCEWCDSRVGRHWPAWCMRMRARMCVCVYVCVAHSQGGVCVCVYVCVCVAHAHAGMPACVSVRVCSRARACILGARTDSGTPGCRPAVCVCVTTSERMHTPPCPPVC